MLLDEFTRANAQKFTDNVGLGLTPPLSAARDPCASTGPVVARPVPGGLHHVYPRAA